VRAAIRALGGVCWLGFGGVFALILIQQVAPGSSDGLLALGISSLGIVTGMLQVTGFVAAIVLCCAMGIFLLASGTVPPPPTHRKKLPPSDIVDCLSPQAEPECRCVRCNAPQILNFHICENCGWTQPQLTARE
jgi:hypothetical protein